MLLILIVGVVVACVGAALHNRNVVILGVVIAAVSLTVIVFPGLTTPAVTFHARGVAG